MPSKVAVDPRLISLYEKVANGQVVQPGITVNDHFIADYLELKLRMLSAVHPLENSSRRFPFYTMFFPTEKTKFYVSK